jgi:hypothetical protein
MTTKPTTRHFIRYGWRSLREAVPVVALWTVGLLVVTVEGWWRKRRGR